jgi:TrmH family RNA methyltransferase
VVKQPAVEIESPTNPRIKSIARLRKRRERDRRNRFVIEGRRELTRARSGGIHLEQVVVDPSLIDDASAAFVDGLDDVPVLRVSPEAFRKVSVRTTPDGVLAVARRFDTAIDSLRVGAPPLLLVVDSVEKPGNLGAILRTADAASASVIVTGSGVDLFSHNVVRASQGSLFSVAVAAAPPSTALPWVLERASIVVADPEADASYWAIDMRAPVALVIGSEHDGVSAAWREAGASVAIPMGGSADSLNASVAAAVLLYEALRQRRTAD